MGQSSSSDARRRYTCRTGFTLIELLIVICIMSVLASLLLPALGRAREQTKMLTCQSNMRQIMLATIRYTQENNDHYPYCAVNAMQEDWVYWHPGRTVNTGGIVRYIGGSRPTQILICPTDDASTHSGGSGAYPFSYSMNINVGGYYPMGDGPCVDSQGRPCAPAWPNYPLALPPPPSPVPLTNKGVGQIKHPSNCILYVEEMEGTLDDGCWAWQSGYGSGQNIMSDRHDQLNRELRYDPSNPTAGRGNAAYCDGHVEFTLRSASWNPMYYDPNQ